MIRAQSAGHSGFPTGVVNFRNPHLLQTLTLRKLEERHVSGIFTFVLAVYEAAHVSSHH